MLFHKYYSLDFIMKTKIRQIGRLLASAYMKENKEKTWDLYITQYPNYTEETYKTFDEYYEEHFESAETAEQTPVEEILEGIARI